jgi:proteasome component ECM29
MAADGSSEARELNLVGKVEMRFALADSDTKLQTLLSTYLAPLLLKLASEHAAVRTKVITVCHHISNRLKSSSTVSLPVRALLKQFREADSAYVRQLDLMFISQGLERIAANDGIELLSDLLRAATPPNWDASTWWLSEQPPPEERIWHIAFHYLLRLLPSWHMPDRGSREDTALRERLDLSDGMARILAHYLGRFLLYDGSPTGVAGGALHSAGRRNVALSESEVRLMSRFDDDSADLPGPRLAQTKIAVANFLFTSVFSDGQRFISAVILSSDTTNLAAFRVGDTMFKQCNFDLESPDNIDGLLSLYHGNNARSSPRAKLKVRILALLTKCKAITRNPTAVLKIMKQQLFAEGGTPASGLEAIKLRSAMFSFLTWVVRMSEEEDLRQIAPEARDSLQDFIETQGWPNPHTTGNGLSHAEVELRSKAYESIGILAAKLHPGVDLVKWLFTSLRCDLSGSQIQVSIEEALGRVLNVFASRSREVVDALRPMLLWNITAEIGDVDADYHHQTKRSTKFVAVRYANRCLPFADVDGRWIDLLAVGEANERPEMVEEGNRGLDPYWYRMANPKALSAAGASPDMLVFPDFVGLVDRVFGRKDGSSAVWEPPGRLRSILAAAVAFCRNILVAEALNHTTNALSIEPDWDRRIDALISTNKEARKALKTYLRHVNAGALLRFVEAVLVGVSLDLDRCGQIAIEICSLCSNDVLSTISSRGRGRVKLATTSSNLLTQTHAARIFGILSSLPAHQGEETDVEAMINACKSWGESVGQPVNEVRGHFLSAAFLITRLSLRQKIEETGPTVADFMNLTSEILVKSRDHALRDAASTAVGHLCLSLPHASQLAIGREETIEALVKNAKKEQETAVAALGRMTWASSITGQSQLAKKALESLYALQDIKRPELHFAVGEALAVAAAGWSSTSTVVEFDIDAELPIYPEDQTLLQDILATVIENCCTTTKPSLKKASAIWLLCLVQYCGMEKAVQSQLRRCQVAFARLLSDRDEVVQESGSRGLSLVYEMGDKNLREDLVHDLVQLFTSTNTSKIMGGSVAEDTELFDTGALPTGDGSITTYKDIVSLASEMGDPSLVYRFMSLASNNAIWTSRAAFGRFGLGTVLADASYLTENKKFYPKLYRYRFDPNPNVQRSMNDIWKALVTDPKAVIDQNFDAILDDLLQSILGKEWRAREASCAAIADLVQGRDVEQFERYLTDIWNVSFKVLDDIKETVRIAAMALCRTLTNLVIRNLEVGERTTTPGRILLGHAMPFLLRQLDSGAAKEVQEYAIISLLQVVQKSPAPALRPFAPIVLETLVNALSSLEHESINYLHLNADKFGLTAEKLDRMRVSSMNSSPITEAIDRCLESLNASPPEGDSVTTDAMNKLEGTFKTVIGLPSKIGLSRVLVTLTVRHSTLFRPYADRFVQLVRRNMLDRNETVSVAYSMSLAYLMRLASEKQIADTVLHAKALYFASEEPAHRVVSAEIIHAISKVSNDVFLRFATAFLPFSFLGKHDDLEDVKSRFAQAWKGNVGGSGSVALYLSEIVDLIAANIQSSRWAIKHACCLAVADLVTSMHSPRPYSTAQARAIWPVVDAALAGKTWDGKEEVIAAFPTFVKAAKSLWTEEPFWTQMKAISIREARRTNATYRPHAITALGHFAEIRADPALTADIISLIRNVVEESIMEDRGRMDVDSKERAVKHAR